MSIEQSSKQRKPKVSKAQTYSVRREADRQQRQHQRERTAARKRAQQQYRFRVKVIRMYSQLRQQVSEREAVSRTLARWQPTQDEHFTLSKSSIRSWYRTVQTEGYNALRPKSRRPHTIHYQVPTMVVGIIYMLRRCYGWGGHRIAAELQARQIAHLCGQTVYNLFKRLGFEVKLYALQGRSDGIAYHRYEAKRPNAQWHIDLKHTTLTDGSKVYVCVILDDYSRYALAAVAGTHKTTAWVAQVTRQALHLAGLPGQIVSDNGLEFAAVWENALTQFGQLLAEQGIEHITTAPHYPQTNGKAEAFIKILTRELLERQTFASLLDLQQALDRFLTYYNNYRLHSALNWQPPVVRFTGRTLSVVGLAALPGLEPMAANSQWGPSTAPPPILITPITAKNAFALVPV